MHTCVVHMHDVDVELHVYYFVHMVRCMVCQVRFVLLYISILPHLIMTSITALPPVSTDRSRSFSDMAASMTNGLPHVDGNHVAVYVCVCMCVEMDEYLYTL